MPHFDVIAEAYDAMIDWDRRLANESPLFRDVFARAGARTVLDSSCGTGRHVAMFAAWGLGAHGSDLSPEMIDHCREVHAGSGATWSVRSFLEKAERKFDV